MSSPWKDLLPDSVEVCGTEYEVRSDYRAVLDICVALQDPELSDKDRAIVALDIFYLTFSSMPPEHYQEAVKKCFWFINCGHDEVNDKKSPKLVNWESDFPYIVAPINRVLGQEVRSLHYMHWWTFMSAFMEIGDCTFAQIVRIRNLKVKGKKLNKIDQEWYKQNRDLVDIKRHYTAEDDALIKQWTGYK